MYRASDIDSRSALIHMTSDLRSCGKHVVYNNLPLLLALPVCPSTPHTREFGCLNTNFTQIKLKRAKLYSDIYDSDESGDENINEGVEYDGDVNGMPLPERIICHRSVKELSELLDNMSYMDSYMGAHDHSWSESCITGSRLNPGLSDEPSRWDEQNWWRHRHRHDMCAVLEITALKKVNKNLEAMQQRTSPSAQLITMLSIPTLQCSKTLILCERTIDNYR